LSYGSLRPRHDDSLYAAAERILRLPERQERARRQRSAAHVGRKPGLQTPGPQAGVRLETRIDGASPPPAPNERTKADYFAVSDRQFLLPSLFDALAQFDEGSTIHPDFVRAAVAPQSFYSGSLTSRVQIHPPHQSNATDGSAASRVVPLNGVARPGVLPGPNILPPVFYPGLGRIRNLSNATKGS
jgi:hypothetical protein